MSIATLDIAAVRARFSALDRRLAFFDGPGLELLAKHGLVPASSEDHPVSRAYAQGARIDIAPS